VEARSKRTTETAEDNVLEEELKVLESDANAWEPDPWGHKKSAAPKRSSHPKRTLSPHSAKGGGKGGKGGKGSKGSKGSGRRAVEATGDITKQGGMNLRL
jgi:hypothetical protein